MTPHLLELKRFIQKEIADIKKDILEIGLAVANQYGIILVCKDAVTSVFDGTGYYINQTGNDGLATAGGGDVLAGITGAMLAKDMDGMKAACISVLLHGLCADYAVKNTGRSYLKAGDLITQLKEMLE